MDDLTDTLMRERMAYEGARDALPQGFPKLPDLPLGRYTEPAVYAEEVKSLFHRTWLFAGHVSELPQAGSYRVLDLPFAPVVLTRDRAGHIHALLNACRHRGAPVVRESCGTAKKLVCQYHSWAYDLDGQLVHTPQARDFEPNIKEGRGLGSIRCEVQNGFVFVNFDQDAPSLQEYMASLTHRFGDLASEDMKLISRKSWDIKCNWKLIVEAFLESYHVDTVHPNTAAAFLQVEKSVMSMHPHGHSTMLIPYSETMISGNEEGDTHWSSTLPTMPEASSFYQDNSASLFAFPNVISALDPAGYPVMTFWPTSIDTVRLDVQWYGVPWEGDTPPEEWTLKQMGFDILTEQDIFNLEPIQESVAVAAHEGVPLSYQERRIWQFHYEVDKLIDTGKIPAELIITDQLSDYVED